MKIDSMIKILSLYFQRIAFKAQNLPYAGLIYAGIIFCAVLSIVPLLSRASLDLTADQRNTLSEGTRSALSQLVKPIEIEFYYSARLLQQVTSYAIYAPRIKELLEDYAHYSGGLIHVRLIDPVPFSEEEDRAIEAGLQPVVLDRGRYIGYFGLVARTAPGRKIVVPTFDPARERLLEYDLTRLVLSLSQEKPVTIGVISSLPLDEDIFASTASEGHPAPWMFWQQLRQLFLLQKIKPSAEKIDDSIDLLLIVHPKNLSESLLSAIRDFMLKKGRAVVLLDPHSEASAARRSFNPDSPADASTLSSLLDEWGIGFDPTVIVADRKLAQRVVIEDVNNPESPRQKALDYVAWLRLTAAEMNRDHPVTASLSRINMATSGNLTLRNDRLKFEPLLSTSPDSMLLSSSTVKFDPDAEGLLSKFNPGQIPLVLAAKYSGKFSADATTDATIIAIADSDFIEDRFWVSLAPGSVRFNANNADLVLNAIENLTGGQALLEIRGRHTSLRPLTKIEDLRRSAESRFLSKEEELRKELDQTQRELIQMQTEAASQKKLAETLDDLRQKISSIRKSLREVQYALNRDIENLMLWTRLLTIIIWPLCVALLLYFTRRLILPFHRR